jgi:site-specific recombinase XerD
MATVWKHPDSPYWTAVFKNESNKWARKTTKKKDRTEALKLAVEWERAAGMGRDRTLTEAVSREVIGGILERTTGEKLRSESLREFSLRWLQGGKHKNKSEGTTTRYTGTVDKFLDFLKSKADSPIASITPSDCEKFYDYLASTKLAPSTLIVEMKTLRSLFNSARRQTLISINPAASVELPETGKQVQRKVFTIEQIRMLLKAAAETAAEADKACDKESAKHAREWQTVILLGMYAGLRLGDAVELGWDAVDFEQCKLTVETRKTGIVLEIPMHPSLEAHLSKLAGDSTGPICPILAAVPIGGRSGLSKQFLAVMRRAGIGNSSVQTGGQRMLSQLSFHALRTSFNSGLHNRGVDQEIRKKLTGHKSTQVNDRYTVTQLETMREAVKKLPHIAY